MSKHLRNDHIFKRPLIWLVSLGLSGMLAYIFLPANILSDDKNKTPSPRYEDFSTVQQPLPPPAIPEQPSSPVNHHSPTQTEVTTPQGKFVKKYLEFHDSKNFYQTIAASGINPVLIAQLAPLKKRLSDNKVTRIDFLYADYLKGERFNPENSKVIAVRFYYGEETSKTFFSKSEKGILYFYDEDGNAPELAMDRIPLTSYDRITSPFNPRRRHPITHRIRPHNGTDFKAPYGTPIHATGNGVVKFAGWQRGYGKVVIIEHLTNYETRYAHLSTITTSAGSIIKRGDVIGKLGNTGASTGAHLHYEVRKDGIPYDPMTIELPSNRPLAANYMNAWHYRCHQQTQAMEEIATTGETNL